MGGGGGGRRLTHTPCDDFRNDSRRLQQIGATVICIYLFITTTPEHHA